MTSELDELHELLEQLEEDSQPSIAGKLHFLSDLSGERLKQVCAAWDTYSADQRRRLVQAMVDLAEANFEVNFDAIFRHCLTDPDEEVRCAAIDGLWEDEEAGLVAPLLTMLRHDPSPQVRAAAAISLGRFVLAGELEKLEETILQRIVSELLEVIRLPGETVEVRRRALESVTYSSQIEVRGLLNSAYYDSDERMRQSAIVGMGRSCDERWIKYLIAELESDSPAMRYEAAWACGELGLPRAVSHLAQLVQDADREVSNAAIWALGQIGGAEARQALLDAYEDADRDMQAALDDAIAEQSLIEGEIEFTLYDTEAMADSVDVFDLMDPDGEFEDDPYAYEDEEYVYKEDEYEE